MFTFMCCFDADWTLKNAIPFSYHTTDHMFERHQHYSATATWTILASFAVMAIFLGVEGFKNAHDKEHDW